MSHYSTRIAFVSARALTHAWDAVLAQPNAAANAGTGAPMAMAARVPATPKQGSHQPRGQALT